MKKFSAIRTAAFAIAALSIQFLLPSHSFADTAQVQAIEQELFQQLASAKNQQAGRQAESELWQFWMNQSPTAEVRTMLDAGMERREAYDFEAAEGHFDQVIEAAPAYAEGYNQRAFVRFLRQNYTGSLDDLEKTLEMKPDHFGALTGMYHILRLQNRHGAAFDMLQRAVVIHPWVQERGALPRDRWPESYKQIHDPERGA